MHFWNIRSTQATGLARDARRRAGLYDNPHRDSVISVMRPLEGGQPTRSAFYVYVPDVDLVHRRAVDAGARSVQEPTGAVQGDRMATVIDPFGNQWTVASRIEQISVEELHRRLAGS